MPHILIDEAKGVCVLHNISSQNMYAERNEIINGLSKLGVHFVHDD